MYADIGNNYIWLYIKTWLGTRCAPDTSSFTVYMLNGHHSLVGCHCICKTLFSVLKIVCCELTFRFKILTNHVSIRKQFVLPQCKLYVDFLKLNYYSTSSLFNYISQVVNPVFSFFLYNLTPNCSVLGLLFWAYLICGTLSGSVLDLYCLYHQLLSV